MKKENNKIPVWSKKTKNEMILTIIGLILSIIVFILAIIDLFGFVSTMAICEPILGLLLLVQAMQYKKYDKSTYLFSLIAGIFILIISIICYIFI